MPANRLVAGMARSYKIARPMGELHEKCKSRFSRGFSWKPNGQLRFLGLSQISADSPAQFPRTPQHRTSCCAGTL